MLTRWPATQTLRTLSVHLTFILVTMVPPAWASSERSTFFLSNEFYGAQAYTDPAANTNYQARLANAFTFWPPADYGMNSFLTSHPGGFTFDMQAATKVKGDSATYIETQRQAVAAICSSVGINQSAWGAMVEWDQGGGAWVPNGRPRYAGLTRTQAYSVFTDYYLNNSPPLGTYLQQTVSQRGCRLLSQTDYAPNTFYAFAMGADIQILERGIDELGDSSTGLAFIRGAGRMYDRPWGIDLSTWRTLADSATEFNSSGLLIGGWSPNYLRRHMFIAFMGGAHKLNIEPTTYYTSPSATQLNPFGQMVKDFGNFALTRHPDVGNPVVPVALMFDFYSGFDTKHGLYNQSDNVWYQDIPYAAGDYMINNFLKVAYPGHWLHGTTSGAPFSDAAGYKSFLLAGGDIRPYEPMPSTRWGDTMDVTLNTASRATLDHYKVIALMGGVVIDNTLRSVLQPWVQAGGTLVVNANQVTTADQTLLGVTLGGTSAAGGASRWVADGTIYTESAYTYKPVTLVTATSLATTGTAPLITSNAVGSGRVILTTPDYLQTSARDSLLSIGIKLFDWLNSQYAPVRVTGSAIEYLLNQSTGNLTITLINNSGTTWSGTVSASISGRGVAVKEYLSDTVVSFGLNGSTVTISGQVPPFDIRVYAIEYSPQNSSNISTCDLNKDSSTNITDVQLCANQAIGAARCGSGDINKDGVCTVVDVQRVVNAALDSPCVSP